MQERKDGIHRWRKRGQKKWMAVWMHEEGKIGWMDGWMDKRESGIFDWMKKKKRGSKGQMDGWMDRQRKERVGLEGVGEVYGMDEQVEEEKRQRKGYLIG